MECQNSMMTTSWENLMPYANNKGADQHLRSLVSAFVVRCLYSIILILAKFKISWLASLCGCAGLFEPYLVSNPEDRFSWDVAQISLNSYEKNTHKLEPVSWNILDLSLRFCDTEQE